MATRLLPYGERSFSLEFDFIEHRLVVAATDGVVRTLKLEPRTVADFYRDFVATLDSMGLGVRMWPVPVEFADPIPFAEDTKHSSYDPRWANRFFHVLAQSDLVLKEHRARFRGRTSPVHFFWGSFDLAVTRFSGRAAPPHPGGVPHLPDEVAREAYAQELTSRRDGHRQLRVGRDRGIRPRRAREEIRRDDAPH